MMRTLTNCSIICAAVLASTSWLIVCEAIGDEYRYALIHVPGLGGIGDRALGLNEHGHVVGSSFVPGGAFHPFLWNGKATIDLGTFGGLDGHAGIAYDINNDGVVVGFAEDENLTAHPFKYEHMLLVDIGEGILEGGIAYSINDQGLIGGAGDFIDGPCCRPILWSSNKIVNLPSSSEQGGQVRAINVNGIMVGSVRDDVGIPHAAAWLNGELTELEGFLDDDPRSTVNGINKENIAVGGAKGVPAEVSSRAAVWDEKGNVHNLSRHANDVGGYLPWAMSINEHNQIVGVFVSRRDDEFHGYVYSTNIGAEALERLIPPYTEWRIEDPRDINNRGQITGFGFLKDDPQRRARSFLLTPVEPEMTLQIADGPLRADAINSLKITNAQPNATIKFFYGKRGGGTRIPGCDALAAMLQINDPVLFGEAVADADGNAALDIYIPPHGAAHKGFLIQAIDFDHCEESQLVLKKVE